MIAAKTVKTVPEEIPKPKEAWASLPLVKRLLVKLGLPVSIGKFQLPGWSGANEFFLFRCSDCGELCIDYLHGWSGYLCCYASNGKKVASL